MTEDFAAGFTHKIIPDEDGGEPIVEFFDPEGNNVTPLPLYVPKEEPAAHDDGSKVSKVPRPNTVLRTFLHVTTALYSMAGLGSLQQSRLYREEINKGPTVDDLMSSTPGHEVVGRVGDPNDIFDEGPSSLDVDEAQSSELPEKHKAERSKTLEIVLEETDTIWMLNIPGTCAEIDPNAPNESIGASNEEHDQEDPPLVVYKYQSVDRWSQTLDFSKKRKGTQSDDINLDGKETQTSAAIRTCLWNHKDGFCKLKYSSTAHALVKFECPNQREKIDVRGNYDENECAILVHNATVADSGIWGCYITEYIGRFNIFSEPEKVSATMNVRVLPKKNVEGISARSGLFCPCSCEDETEPK
eukprot:maker-scaffold389_size186684-snap-gene-0.21 protein:Tk00872 transcript:maker-scaffold389_size186684-snap-gene-0.21-mRNA-1 annotation:"wd repeat-containing protein 78"